LLLGHIQHVTALTLNADNGGNAYY
jgi:hypothetical protein